MSTATGRLGVLFSVFLILLAFLAPGCSENGPSIDPDEIAARAVAAQTALGSYRMDAHVSAEVAGEPGEAENAFTGFMDTSGAVDGVRRRLQLDLTMGMGKDAASASLKYYGQAFLVDNHLYAAAAMTRAEFQWTRTDLAADYWQTAELMRQQVNLLQSSGRDFAGEETVDGVGCYVFNLTADLAQAVAALNLETLLGQETWLPSIKQEWIRSATVRQWIAKDTSFLTKTKIHVALQMPAAELGLPQGEDDLDATVIGEAHFHSYNERMPIEVPPEAIAQAS